MSRLLFRSAQIFIDLAVLSFAFWMAFMLRFEFSPGLFTLKLLFFTWPYVIVFQYLLLVAFGVPRFSWRYVGLREAVRIFGAIGVGTAVLVSLRIGLAPFGGYSKFVIIPLSILGMNFVLSFLGITGVRVLRRIVAEKSERRARTRTVTASSRRTLLIGAGQAGVMVAREVTQNPHLGINIVGFVDDDVRKVGTLIQGHKVLGDSESMEALVEEYNVEQAIICIASSPGSSIREIVKKCEVADVPVKIIPGLHEIIGGQVNLSRIRKVTIDDLLGREAVELDVSAIEAFLTNKRILVTGAGGSIGSEACRQIGLFNPEKLILVEQAENSLFNIHRELSRTQPQLCTIPCICDVCDFDRVEELFSVHKPQVVFHAAAHKHVPMMEWNPGEAIKNNVFGTKTIADAAHRHQVEEFVMISTDKAVNPTSIMGTSKRVAEIYIQGMSQRSLTKFVAVRFGNVLGSAGSVIPTFKEQISRGGPVTVTHPDMQRYFMTIPEACQLVMQAATMGRGGDIFVLDMGEPVFIVDLARDLIRLSGFSQEEIPIEYSGLRPGEKLFEELSTDSEEMAKTRHKKIFIGKIDSYPIAQVENGLHHLSQITNCLDSIKVRASLAQMVPEMLEPDTDKVAKNKTNSSLSLVPDDSVSGVG